MVNALARGVEGDEDPSGKLWHLCNDKTAFPYKQATKFIERSQSIDKIRCDLINNRNTIYYTDHRVT